METVNEAGGVVAGRDHKVVKYVRLPMGCAVRVSNKLARGRVDRGEKPDGVSVFACQAGEAVANGQGPEGRGVKVPSHPGFGFEELSRGVLFPNDFPPGGGAVEEQKGRGEQHDGSHGDGHDRLKNGEAGFTDQRLSPLSDEKFQPQACRTLLSTPSFRSTSRPWPGRASV